MYNDKIIFFGTGTFSCAVLKMLMEEKYNVIAAVSQPDRPVGRKHIITATPVHALCDTYGIPCLQPEKLRKESHLVTDLKPDLIITCSYGQIVPDDILACPPKGCINVHPSLLPKYRGASPMHYPIINGDSETGVSLMEMTHAMDAGRVYAQVKLPIGPDDTEADLEPRLREASVRLLRDNLPAYLEGKLPGWEQDESKVTVCHMIPREFEQVHFRQEKIDDLYNHIRGLIDWPLPYGLLEGKRVKFYKARKEVKEVQEAPGTVIGFDRDSMLVAADGGVIHLYELQMEGHKRMNAQAFRNGMEKETVGKRFD
jgi:methionyl-tRNA formyltransferase